jgi:hypothetical protein
MEKNLLCKIVIMTILKEKLTEAITAKQNDVTQFTWKLSKQSDGSQPEIRMVDATPEQLQQFYSHCMSMLYSTDKSNPGRYTLLEMIKEQRYKCNIELFMRKIEMGSISVDGKGYPKFMYWQNILDFKQKHADYFAEHSFLDTPISMFTGRLPREFENITIGEVKDSCLDQLGIIDTKHITFSFIFHLGIYLTPAELKEFNEKDTNGNKKNRLELVKERLNIKNNVKLIVKPGGLSYAEFRAMLNLRNKRKYSELTTDQLTALRNKVLFRLENEVMFHIEQWEERVRQLKLVAESKGITLKNE